MCSSDLIPGWPASGCPVPGCPVSGCPVTGSPVSGWPGPGDLDRRDGPERGITGVTLHDRVAAGQLVLGRVHRRCVDPGAGVQVRQELARPQFPQFESTPHPR